MYLAIQEYPIIMHEKLMAGTQRFTVEPVRDVYGTEKSLMRSWEGMLASGHQILIWNSITIMLQGKS